MSVKDHSFANELLNYASKLDAVTNSHGEISKAAAAVVDEREISSTLYLVNLASEIITSSEYDKEIRKLASVFKESILKFYGYIHIMEFTSKACLDDDPRDLRELLDELNSLIGLTDVKNTVNDLIAYQKVKQLREQQGLYSEKNTMHLAFTGNPGTGKTTVARIIGHVYKRLGLLSKGHFVEVSRTDLIAGYQGQTALKVKKVVERAKGGVLFIDEAYSITENDHSDSYGRECLTELTKALEDYRDDLVVIVAGYSEPMKKFFESNPGLRSRFNTFIEFEDFSGSELNEILGTMCKKNNYELSEIAAEYLKKTLQDLSEHKGEQFANGRLVRNIYDDLVMNHARRVANIENATRDQLIKIAIDDIPASLLKSNSRITEDAG